jgi:hypothetical protein
LAPSLAGTGVELHRSLDVVVDVGNPIPDEKIELADRLPAVTYLQIALYEIVPAVREEAVGKEVLEVGPEPAFPIVSEMVNEG